MEAEAAEAQVDEVLAALDEALLLIDRKSVRYEEVPEREGRLLNLAIFDPRREKCLLVEPGRRGSGNTP